MCGEGREGVRYWGVTERAIHTWVGVHGSSNRSYVEIKSQPYRSGYFYLYFMRWGSGNWGGVTTMSRVG